MESSVPAPFERPFTIHHVNNYTYMGLTGMVDYFTMAPKVVGNVIREAYREVTAELNTAGVEYSQLGSALTPRRDRYEVAYIFDSTQAENQWLYGYSYADKWIPILKRFGPRTTTVSAGDISELPSELVWQVLERRLVGAADFPRLYTTSYYVIYVTNLSQGQVGRVDEALTAATSGYLGYVDCSTWNPLKLGLYLPQVALRVGDTIVTAADEDGIANLPGYPFEESGFRIVGVCEEHYHFLLESCFDNGIPEWAEKDSSTTLTALVGNLEPLATSEVLIHSRRLEYLKATHRDAFVGAGFAGLTEAEVAAAISAKLSAGLVHNLRFKLGTDLVDSSRVWHAFMFSVQVEFPTATGQVRRYQVGLKYDPGTHTSEIATFY